MIQALILNTETRDGKRTYCAFDKLGNVLSSVSVHDSGHGAKVALDWFRVYKNTEPSNAAWTSKLIYQLERAGKIQH